MVARKNTGHRDRARRPPITAEAHEQMMCSLANDLAEKQLRDGSASSQVMVQYIKLGSTREKLEQERLQRDNELLRAKVEQLSSGAKNEELLERALKAFRGYSGTDEDEDQYDEEYFYD